jgi:hypothetical protein
MPVIEVEVRLVIVTGSSLVAVSTSRTSPAYIEVVEETATV